jgi:activating signal cointegrator complex subunit 3
MVAHSSEFENIVVREEEQDELETLARKACPLEIKGGPTDKHGKISILIQVIVDTVTQLLCSNQQDLS